jgi:regulator of protease activity HflC (stomatin/prohibitin superfamily)
MALCQALSVAIGIVVLIVLILILASINSIEPTEWALLYSGISKSIDTAQIYGSGLHVMLIWNSFIKFPSTYNTVEFSKTRYANAPPLSTRTKEGLAIQLHISF